MSRTSIGEIRRRMTLEQAVRVSDGAGGVVESWSEVERLWAAVRPLGGGEGFEADKRSGRHSHEIVIRYRDGVAPHMRFRFGTRVFEILSVIDRDSRRAFLNCLTEERDL